MLLQRRKGIPLFGDGRVTAVPTTAEDIDGRQRLNFQNMANNKIQCVGADKPRSRRDEIYTFISEVVTEDTEKYLTSEKERALKESAEFQSAKKELARIRKNVLSPVVNKSWANLMAKAMWKRYGFKDSGTLRDALCDENGVMFRDGHSVSVSTIAEAASFMVEWEKSLIRTTRKEKDQNAEIISMFNGAMGIGLFTAEECASKTAEKFGTTAEEILSLVHAHIVDGEKSEKDK